MMQTLGVRNLKDIFDLQIIDILRLEGFKEKSATNLFNEISNARDVTDYQLLAALNIPNIGPNVAKMILAEYTIEELRSLTSDDLAKINGVGPERAEALCRELSQQSDFLDELLAALNVKYTKGTEAEARPTICFTGKMPEKRSYYEKLASDNGYEPADSVTKELSILVADNPESSGGKLTKARKLNVKIMSLENWLASLSEETDVPEEAPSNQDDLFSLSDSEEKQETSNTPEEDQDLTQGDLFLGF
jgi:DNA ligase (NAD+)